MGPPLLRSERQCPLSVQIGLSYVTWGTQARRAVHPAHPHPLLVAPWNTHMSKQLVASDALLGPLISGLWTVLRKVPPAVGTASSTHRHPLLAPALPPFTFNAGAPASTSVLGRLEKWPTPHSRTGRGPPPCAAELPGRRARLARGMSRCKLRAQGRHVEGCGDPAHAPSPTGIGN